MAAKPNMIWDSQDATGPVVWWTRLDRRYQIEVVRVDDRRALLRIFDHEHLDQLLLEEEVYLAYGAIFGPDVDDVRQWQERALYFVDNEMTS